LCSGLPCSAVTCCARVGGGSTPSSRFRREAKELRSLSSPRIFVRATSVGCFVVRTWVSRCAIGAVSTRRAGAVASSFSTPADKPIVFILRQNNNSAIRRRGSLPRKTGGIYTRTLSAFDCQRLVRGELYALAFSARFLGGFPFYLWRPLGGCR